MSNVEFTKEEIEEWADSPITQKIFEVIRERQKLLRISRGDVFYQGEPNRTQETLAFMNGQIFELELVLNTSFQDEKLYKEEDDMNDE